MSTVDDDNDDINDNISRRRTLSKLKKNELQQRCCELGLPVNGLKNDLIDRIVNFECHEEMDDGMYLPTVSQDPIDDSIGNIDDNPSYQNGETCLKHEEAHIYNTIGPIDEITEIIPGFDDSIMCDSGGMSFLEDHDAFLV